MIKKLNVTLTVLDKVPCKYPDAKITLKRF